MSFSWPLPPPGFAAYERLKLGWLTPQIVNDTTRDLWLPRAEETLAAVKVPTSRESEYFLFEYRTRPATGYASDDANYNGLAVYHVLEGSSMAQDPPIVKLEPADGSIQPSQPLDVNDLASPDNPLLLRPMVLFSYYGDNQEVFRIENVAWRDGGISFDIIMSGMQPSPNLLVNASFESGAGLPDGWARDSYIWAPTAFVWPSPVARTGQTSAHLNASFDNDARWIQTVSTLVPGQPYQLCGWLKGENIAGSGTTGANVSLMGGFVGSVSLQGTFDWTESCVIFTAQASRADVACRLGFYGSTVSGRLWCDDLTLVRIRKAF
jgi:hypothetical protein